MNKGRKNKFCFKLIHLFVQQIDMEEVLKLWKWTCSLRKVMRGARRRLIHFFYSKKYVLNTELHSQCVLPAGQQTRKSILCLKNLQRDSSAAMERRTDAQEKD